MKMLGFAFFAVIALWDVVFAQYFNPLEKILRQIEQGMTHADVVRRVEDSGIYPRQVLILPGMILAGWTGEDIFREEKKPHADLSIFFRNHAVSCISYRLIERHYFQRGVERDVEILESIDRPTGCSRHTQQ